MLHRVLIAGCISSRHGRRQGHVQDVGKDKGTYETPTGFRHTSQCGEKAHGDKHQVTVTPELLSNLYFLVMLPCATNTLIDSESTTESVLNEGN